MIKELTRSERVSIERLTRNYDFVAIVYWGNAKGVSLRQLLARYAEEWMSSVNSSCDGLFPQPLADDLEFFHFTPDSERQVHSKLEYLQDAPHKLVWIDGEFFAGEDTP